MSEQTTFLSRIGKWFRKDADGYGPGSDGDLPLTGDLHGGGTSIEPRSTFLRPWAKRDADIASIRDGFHTLTDLMGAIQENLERQNVRQEELMRHLAQLPQTLQMLPENSRVQSETLRGILAQVEHQSGQQSRLAEILERITVADAQQRSTLDALTDRVETLNQHDARMADNLNSVGSAMEAVSRNSQTSAQVLEQMRDNLNSRDGQLERVLQKQGSRFTTMLAVAIFLSIAALVAVGIFGYLGYEAIQRMQ